MSGSIIKTENGKGKGGKTDVSSIQIKGEIIRNAPHNPQGYESTREIRELRFTFHLL